MDKQSNIHKAGYVAVMGRPNVGKSTIMNAIIGQKIAAVSPRPQTTRKSQLGILTRENAQIIFMDTPGLHQPHHKLGKYMNQNAIKALDDADLILFILDCSEASAHKEDQILVDLLKAMPNHPKVIMAINKVDRVDASFLAERESQYAGLLPQAETILVSATRRDNLDSLLELLVSNLPEADPFYPEEQVTDLYEREISADLIRAAALLHLRDEIPHAAAVRIDEYTERGDTGVYIEATLFVERDSQKGIVIGKGGEMLKRIGTTARLEIESMSSRKAFLRLRVKVRKNWRNDDKMLRRFGYQVDRKD
jgi:GTP-binding protein Era